MKAKLAITLLLGGLCAQAGIVTPVSYDTPNGYTGTYTYWDESYTGAGNTASNGAALSGGLGDLTNGIIAASTWDVVEAPPEPGPYVGWTIDPTIVFNFASLTDFSTIRIHFDDSNGNGGVSAPASVTINGTNFLIADPAGTAPFWAEFNVSSIADTDTLSIQLNRRDVWVFASEFEFQDGDLGAVPEPATLAIMGSGLAALAVLRRRVRQ